MRNIPETDLTIRPITAGDTALLSQFFESLSESSRSFFRPHPFNMAMVERITGEELSDLNIRRFLAVLSVDGRDIAAGYVFFWDWTKQNPTLGIAVSDSFQGRGLGKRLIDFLIEEARKHGKNGLALTTDKINIRGQALYLKCGFRIMREGENDDYIMKLDL